MRAVCGVRRRRAIGASPATMRAVCGVRRGTPSPRWGTAQLRSGEGESRTIGLAGRAVRGGVGFEVAEARRKLRSRTGATALHGAFGHAKQPGGVGN
jgi:hypothetical protein